MYEILRGTIKNRKIVEGTAYYNIQYGESPTSGRKMAYGIRHGFQMDPSGGNAVYEEGTSVYFTGNSGSIGVSDGVVLAAVRSRAGGLQSVESPLKDVYEQLTEAGGELGGAEGLTGGDVFYRRGLSGVFKFAYNGMYKILSKIGLGWIIDPGANRMHGYAENFEFTFGNYGNFYSEILPDSGEAKLHFHFNNSSDQLDPNASLVTLDIGTVDNLDNRIKLTVLDANTGIAKTKLLIDRQGKVEIITKEISLNISSDGGETSQGELKIDEFGNAEIRTETLKLGKKVDVDQNFVRGKDFKENYDDLLSMIKNHEHPVASGKAIKSLDLVTLSEKELEEDKELSSKNFLD